MDLSSLCNQVREISSQTAKYISQQSIKFSSKSIEYKGFNDFVSYVDKNAEIQLVHELSKILPSAGFITEEGTNNNRQDVYNWIIDPLDGTTNFIHGLSPYAISVALMEKNKIVIGLVHEIGMNEVFYTWKDAPAYLNDIEINVSQTNTVQNSLIATGFPYKEFDDLPQFMNTLSYFMKTSHGIRRLGSAATDLAYLACGRFEAFYEYGLNPWDVAAGAFLVQQAGGKVCDFRGTDNWLFGKEIIASNSLIFNEFYETIYKIMCTK
jgi:myo-inositol-1(or 4)-monophosphatase